MINLCIVCVNGLYVWCIYALCLCMECVRGVLIWCMCVVYVCVCVRSWFIVQFSMYEEDRVRGLRRGLVT